MRDRSDLQEWHDVLAFWFPEGRSLAVDAARHDEQWFWRMRGGADSGIVARFSGLAARAAEGDLEGWASDPGGRLALIVVLDQFSRSVWRGSTRAYAQDPAALSLAVDGISNGHYAALPAPWLKIVHGLPLGHCEGPDHLERIDILIGLREKIAAAAPLHLQPIYRSLVKQARDVREVVAAFGRHPHRNAILGRPSSEAEEAYIAAETFPHLRAFEP